MVSKPCKNTFLYPILVKSSNEKEIKFRLSNGAHQKNKKNTIKIITEA